MRLIKDICSNEIFCLVVRNPQLMRVSFRDYTRLVLCRCLYQLHNYTTTIFLHSSHWMPRKKVNEYWLNGTQWATCSFESFQSLNHWWPKYKPFWKDIFELIKNTENICRSLHFNVNNIANLYFRMVPVAVPSGVSVRDDWFLYCSIQCAGPVPI